MSSCRRPDAPERTLWTEYEEEGDCAVTFSKFGREKCEEVVVVEEDFEDDIDRRSSSESQKSRRKGGKKQKVGAKKSKDTPKLAEKTKETDDDRTTNEKKRIGNPSPPRRRNSAAEEEETSRRTSVSFKQHERGKKSPSSVFITASSSSSEEEEEEENEKEKTVEEDVVVVADSSTIKILGEDEKISSFSSAPSFSSTLGGDQKINSSKNTTKEEIEEEEEEKEIELQQHQQQSRFDVEKEKLRELRRQNVLERVQRVAEILALTPTTTRKKEPSTEREEKELNEGAFATDKEQERVALSLIDEEDDETELYSKIAALRLQLRRYKELASAAQKRNEEWETERLELTKETNELKIERFKLKSCLNVLSAQQQVQEYVESSSANRGEEEEEYTKTSEKTRKAKTVSATKNELVENATLEMENAAKANVTANNRSVQAMREAQRLEDELVAHKEASREENEALMIEASRSRIRAREFKRELEESKESFASIEKELRAELMKKTEEHEKVMDEKDKRMHTLRLRLEEIEKRNTFLESKNEELETALESDAGAYYGAQLRKVREAHEEMLSREQLKLERVQEELRIEKEKAAENKNKLENFKRALKFRTFENEKHDVTAWSNALGLNDDNSNNAVSPASSPSSPSSVASSPTSSVVAAAASATKRLQMKQQRIEMQDSLLRMARDETEELRDVNRRLLERHTSRCNSAASLYRSDSAQGILTVPSSRASSRPLSRTSSRNNNNFNAFDDHQIPEDDELSVEARAFLNTPYYYGASPQKKNRASGEKLRKTDSTVSLSLRETANDDVNLAPLGSWASFEASAASPKRDDCNRRSIHTDDGDILSLTNTTNATSEEEEVERDAELAHNSRKLQAFFEKGATTLSRSSSASSRLTEHRGYSPSKALEMSIKEGEAVMRSVNVRASRHFSRSARSKGVSSDRYYDENGE
jgi:hypothetical protein